MLVAIGGSLTTPHTAVERPLGMHALQTPTPDLEALTVSMLCRKQQLWGKSENQTLLDPQCSPAEMSDLCSLSVG